MTGQLQILAVLPPEKEPAVAVQHEAGWATQPAWTLRRRQKSLVPAGNRKTFFGSPVRGQVTTLIILPRIRILFVQVLSV